MSRRKWKANRPDNAVLITTVTLDGQRWELYETLPAENWQNVKLIAVPSRAGKANYWMGWHLTEERFARSIDVELLCEHAPDVAHWLEMVLRDGADAAALVYGK